MRLYFIEIEEQKDNIIAVFADTRANALAICGDPSTYLILSEHDIKHGIVTTIVTIHRCGPEDSY